MGEPPFEMMALDGIEWIADVEAKLLSTMLEISMELRRSTFLTDDALNSNAPITISRASRTACMVMPPVVKKRSCNLPASEARPCAQVIIEVFAGIERGIERRRSGNVGFYKMSHLQRKPRIVAEQLSNVVHLGKLAIARNAGFLIIGELANGAPDRIILSDIRRNIAEGCWREDVVSVQKKTPFGACTCG